VLDDIDKFIHSGFQAAFSILGKFQYSWFEPLLRFSKPSLKMFSELGKWKYSSFVDLLAITGFNRFNK
jgi:hypothetical protein